MTTQQRLFFKVDLPKRKEYDALSLHHDQEFTCKSISNIYSTKCLVSGRLVGGNPLCDRGDTRCTCNSSSSSLSASYSSDDFESQTTPPPSATLTILQNLASKVLLIVNNERWSRTFQSPSRSSSASPSPWSRSHGLSGTNVIYPSPIPTPLPQWMMTHGLFTVVLPLLSSMMQRVLMIEDGTTKLNLNQVCVNSSSVLPRDADEGSYTSSYEDENDCDHDDDCCSDYDYPCDTDRIEANTVGHSSSSSLNHVENAIHEISYSAMSDSTIANTTSMDPMYPLHVSISSLAEAYYTEQAQQEIINHYYTQPRSLLSHDGNKNQGQTDKGPDDHTTPGTEEVTQEVYPPMDYVVTQMDITRMARDASRHLDVESILKLPTITYSSKEKNKLEDSKCHGCQDVSDDNAETMKHMEEDDVSLGWSWISVPNEVTTEYSDDHQTTNKNAITSTKKGHDMNHQKNDPSERCVICLELFEDGDRLRLLPCGHSFHMGCIDKWLSGSFSYNDCITSGCPTCKKSPMTASKGKSISVKYGDDVGSLECISVGGSDAGTCEIVQEGSVPSWAFMRLGGRLARQSS